MKFTKRIIPVVFSVLSLCLLLPNPSFSEEADMVLIKEGCFMMGTDKVFWYHDEGWDNERERPAHKVCLDAFYMDKYEAWQEKWEKIMGYNNATYKGPDLPISGIDWRSARTFCKKQGKRLPTEAEWEYAARAGSQTINPEGDALSDDHLWWGGNSFRTYPKRGTKKPNAWGLYDMMGSVWEWVNDWYSIKYYLTSPEKNPQGPEVQQSWRVIRGGSWVDEEKNFRVTVRMRGMADATEDFWVGVRCAKSLEK
jgi:formylglycine-generating enzyme